MPCVTHVVFVDGESGGGFREALSLARRMAKVAAVEPTKEGLVRIVLKRAYSDGTVAVEMDPLSLLCRLATSVPPPRYHTVKYSVLRRKAFGDVA
jgi:hypothetical protein